MQSWEQLRPQWLEETFLIMSKNCPLKARVVKPRSPVHGTIGKVVEPLRGGA
jgi:hypothetical protein